VLMTSPELPSGSARVLATARILGNKEDSTLGENYWDLVLNVQGDMPFIKPEVITKAVEFMLENPQFEMGTIATPIFLEENFQSSSVVKVVVSEKWEGFYFSRAPIPHSRDGERMTDLQGRTVFGYKHIGLYVFRPKALRVYDDQTGLQLENIEKLEQIRALEMGYRIGVCIIPEELMEPAIEVDTPDDLTRAEEIAHRNNLS
jgi:3-deoxy-manno-octulosonate cytidylyltransferase (CMP-KDO synthetase)